MQLWVPSVKKTGGHIQIVDKVDMDYDITCHVQSSHESTERDDYLDSSRVLSQWLLLNGIWLKDWLRATEEQLLCQVDDAEQYVSGVTALIDDINSRIDEEQEHLTFVGAVTMYITRVMVGYIILKIAIFGSTLMINVLNHLAGREMCLNKQCETRGGTRRSQHCHVIFNRSTTWSTLWLIGIVKSDMWCSRQTSWSF